MMKTRTGLLAFVTAISVTFMLGVSGCETLKGTNPVAPALESGKPEVIAFALEGSYTIVQGKAKDIAVDPATPQNIREVIDCVQLKVNPILDDIRPVAVEAEALRAKVVAAGEGAEGNAANTARLAAILKDLNTDVNKVAPLVTDLVAAIAGKAQGVCAS